MFFCLFIHIPPLQWLCYDNQKYNTKTCCITPPPLNKFLLDTKEYARIRHLTQSYIKDSQMHITQEQIANVKASLRTRMAMIDFDILGRTLAYSPYMPRANKEFFIRNERQNTL